jgi:hypothetical protein
LQDRHVWQPIATAPFDRDLQLSVIENGEVYSLVFACRRTQSGWLDAATKKSVFVDPTHWREWSDQGGAKPDNLPALFFLLQQSGQLFPFFGEQFGKGLSL